jgi:rod shape-determining protein MreD
VILTPGTVIRLALLVIATVLLEISAVSGVRVLGGNADLVALLVGAAALYGGSLAGAATGFFAGLLMDLLLGQSLGLSSLVLTVVGYWVGSYRELRDSGHGLLPIVVGAASSLAYVVGIAVVSFMLEVSGASVSALVLRDMFVQVLLNTVIALPVFVVIRRVLRPVLVVDPLERRRRRRVSSKDAGPIGLRGLEIGR